ncbi:unnamed protein product [Moneuplotes crassus]|uniref:Uncharacterized protein n=1 Tax=Euplotes crassus TaxID=5936 RepID=A0AAD1X8J6_EUPCR|nr:unnamed protein product [Moneuplotes crassus]
MSSNSLIKFLESQVQRTQANLTKLSEKVDEFEFRNMQFKKVDDVLDKMMLQIKRLQTEKDQTTRNLENKMLILEEKVDFATNFPNKDLNETQEIKKLLDGQLRDFEYKLRSEYEFLVKDMKSVQAMHLDCQCESKLMEVERRLNRTLEQQAKDIALDVNQIERRISSSFIAMDSDAMADKSQVFDKFLNEVNTKFYNIEKQVNSLEMKVLKSESTEEGFKVHNSSIPYVERTDLKLLEARMDDKFEGLVHNLSSLTQKVAIKNRSFESQFETLENTIANSLLSKSKRVRNRTASTRRSHVRPKLAPLPKSHSRTRKSSVKKSNRAKELRKSAKTRNKKSIRRTKSRNKKDQAKTTYSHDDYIISESACEDARSYRPSVHFATDEVTPQNADGGISLNEFQFNTDSLDHYKSISLLDFENFNDNKTSQKQKDLLNQARKEEFQNFVEKEKKQAHTNDQDVYGLEDKNPNSNEGYCPINVVQHKISKSYTHEDPKSEVYKELKQSVAGQFQEKSSREQTFESNPNWAGGKENDRNHKNITFAKSDSNMSTIKSNTSLKQTKKMEKLEKLYNELSILQKSMN